MTPAGDADQPGIVLLDTHVLVWSAEDRPRLGSGARRAINAAARTNQLLVSAISAWEIALLVSKARLNLSTDVLVWIHDVLSKPGVNLVQLEPEIAVASTRLPFEMHPDPADRMLVATARHLGATLVTADKLLLGLGKKGHLKVMNAER